MSPRDFPLAAPGLRVVLLPIAIGVSALCVLVGTLLAAHAGMQDWLRASPPFALVLLVLPLVAWRMNSRKVRLDDRGLDVHRLPWSRAVPLAELDLQRAQVVDLSQHRELQPTIKLMGSRVPGYRSGHFRLRNGARASLAITDPKRVLVLPRHNGNYLLLSVESPGALLDALRRAAERRG
jgi:hypothetical protein